MRALVISDTHFGAWTGEDILREPQTLALLEPHLDVDEVILLGDMFDFLFSSMRDAFNAAGPLLDLLRDKLQGKRFVDIADYHGAMAQEHERRQQTGAPAGGEVANLPFARVVRASDPSGPAIDAFETVVANLGWARDTDKIVFAHTHQPLDGVTTRGGHIRYWNTGSWIYEPALSSPEAYIGYLTNAWPGTAVLIDSDEPNPRLLKIREHLNPSYRDRTNDNREGTRARM